MYERMLDKSVQPSPEAFAAHCGSTGVLLEQLDRFLTEQLGANKQLRFPYGNRYGWGYRYAAGRKHLCDVFAEQEAFTVMLRLSNSQFERVYGSLLLDTRELVDGKYPCGDGGWIHLRILDQAHLRDAQTLLAQKAGRAAAL